MPSATQGFSGSEIVEHVRAYIGNQSTSFTTFLSTAVPLAEQMFCGVHDWNFLNKKDLPLTVVSGTMYYDLTVATVGFIVAAENIVTITSRTGDRVVRKVTLDYIRQIDPDNNDGTVASNVLLWAPSGDQQIAVYTKNFAETTLYIDAKITPNGLFTLSNYPTIPLKYQNSFIEYVKAVALDREDDDRFDDQREFANKLIMRDIQADQSGLGDKEDPRIKAPWEMQSQGTGDLNRLYNLWAFYG